MKEGIGKEELKSRIPKRSDPRFFGPLLPALEKEGKAVAERDMVKLPGRNERGHRRPGRASVTALKRRCARGGMEPPTIKELCERMRCTEKEALEHLNCSARGQDRP